MEEMKNHVGDSVCLYLCPDYILPVIFKIISSKLKKLITFSHKMIIYYSY